MTRHHDAPVDALRALLGRFEYPASHRHILAQAGDERIHARPRDVQLRDVLSMVSTDTFTSREQAVALALEAYARVTPRGAD